MTGACQIGGEGDAPVPCARPVRKNPIASASPRRSAKNLRQTRTPGRHSMQVARAGGDAAAPPLTPTGGARPPANSARVAIVSNTVANRTSSPAPPPASTAWSTALGTRARALRLQSGSLRPGTSHGSQPRGRRPRGAPHGKPDGQSHGPGRFQIGPRDCVRIPTRYRQARGTRLATRHNVMPSDRGPDGSWFVCASQSVPRPDATQRRRRSTTVWCSAAAQARQQRPDAYFRCFAKYAVASFHNSNAGFSR